MNLPITADAEKAFHSLAKVSKVINKDKVLPYWLVFEVKGESIDVVATNEPYTEVITPANFEKLVWEPLVEKIITEYAKNGCMVAVDYVYTTSDGVERAEPVFFKWCPDFGVPVRTKMLLGASFQACKKKLEIQALTPEATLASELEYKKFGKACNLRGLV